MKSYFLYIVLLTLGVCFGCKHCGEEYGYTTTNESTIDVRIYIANGGFPGNTFYPDSLPKSDKILSAILKPNMSWFWGQANVTLEEQFSKFPKDTLSVYFFSTDTINKYEWRIIREKNKYLKRFDLSLQQLKDLNLKIVYK